MSEFPRIITLIELLSVTAFTCYAGVFLLPISVIAAVIFFLLACLPLYAILHDIFAQKPLIKAPMEDFVSNLIIIFATISTLSDAPELAVITYSAITLAAIDICVNILNFVSPKKEFLTYKNATIHKISGILAVSEWILMAAFCVIVAWTFRSETWWIPAIALIALTLIGYISTLKRNNPGSSAPIGGILLDLTVLVYCPILYIEEPAHRAIILFFTLITAVDFIRCIMRKTCTISNIDQL